MSKTRSDLDHHLKLFDQYQATIKNARMEGYKILEKSRSEALNYRNILLQDGRGSAEKLILDARAEIQKQIGSAKVQLETEAQEIARRIASAILRRSA
jgi:F0F1-type ATP synthase membrane subunit b/b'